jgi:hypothetical protein
LAALVVPALPVPVSTPATVNSTTRAGRAIVTPIRHHNRVSIARRHPHGTTWTIEGKGDLAHPTSATRCPQGRWLYAASSPGSQRAPYSSGGVSTAVDHVGVLQQDRTSVPATQQQRQLDVEPIAGDSASAPGLRAPITGMAARRTETEPAWYTPHATAAFGLEVARDRNPQRPRGLLEPSAGKPARGS